MLLRFVCSIALAAVADTAMAAPVNWVDWQSYTTGTVTGVAHGTLTTSTGVIDVTYTGNLFDAFLSPADSGGTNPWPGLPYTAYITPAVDNLPPNHQVLWQERGTWTATLTFSEPVSDIYMPVISLGGGVGSIFAVEYQFDTPFDIVSTGSGLYGNGPFALLPGNVLHGEEGHGIIHFQGPLTSITWNTSYVAYEGQNGFTFGVASVPEPATVSLVLAGLFASLPRRR
jgi:hypothetical protein